MEKGKRHWSWVVLLGLCLTPAVAGAVPKSVRQEVESSLLVEGTIHIERDGSVSAMILDHEDKLPSGVVTFVRNAGRRWRFEPVVRDGAVVKVSAPMSVRVVAKKLEGGQYQVSLVGASFERYDRDDPHGVRSVRMDPPCYPEQAFRAGASGSVYLLVKVGRQGQVEDAIAEQVNLRVLGNEGELRLLRNMFAKSAIAATRNWSFRVPTEGEAAEKPFWNVRVPVTYSMGAEANDGLDGSYGKWISYIPGPRQKAPWVEDKEAAGFSPDTLKEGGVYMADSQGPRLLTSLQGG